MFTYRSEDFPPLTYKVQSKEGLKEKPYKLAYQAAAFAQEKILQGLIREFSEDLAFLQESILDNPINNLENSILLKSAQVEENRKK